MVTAWENPNHHFIELPSLDEIAEMDKQRDNAVESLEIFNNGKLTSLLIITING
jgi:hypothetical protein